MKSKVHILGAKGFIGKNLSIFFSKEKKYEKKDYDLPDLDLSYYPSLEKKLKDVEKNDSIIMTSSITRLVENSLDSNIKNVKMIGNLSRFLEKNPIGHITFLSTTDVYGIVKEGTIIDEQTNIMPKDYYSVSKCSCEFILKNCCSKRNIPLLILRLSGIYGSGDVGKSTLSRLVSSAIKEKKIIIEDDVKRDFVYVEDLCNLIKRGIEQKKDLTVNVATGSSYKISELAEFISELLPKKVEIIKNPRERTTKRNKDMIYNISLLNENFPGFNFMDIQETLSLYIKNFFMKNG